MGCGVLIFVTTGTCVYLGARWYKHRNDYPIRERSPYLSLFMVGVLAIFLNLFPIQVLIKAASETGNNDSAFYRLMYFTFKYTAYFIYFVRSLRIWYAYNVSNSRKNTFIFKKIMGD